MVLEFHKLKYHGKLDFAKLKYPKSGRNLHISETIVNCNIVYKKCACKVVIYNYILCWLYFMTKSVIIALIYFLVFLGDFIVLGLVLSS